LLGGVRRESLTMFQSGTVETGLCRNDTSLSAVCHEISIKNPWQIICNGGFRSASRRRNSFAGSKLMSRILVIEDVLQMQRIIVAVAEKAVRDALIKAGVEASRITAEGYGSSQPIFGVAVDSPKQRRVELRFIGVPEDEKSKFEATIQSESDQTLKP
jgi:hypothetical protein